MREVVIMKKKLFSWISLLVFLAGLAVGSFLPAEPASAQADAAPLTLDTKTLYGKSFSSSVFKNYDLILVNYWAEWCGPCVGELPDLQKLSQEYKNVLFIGAYVDGNNEAAIETAEAAGVTYPLISVLDNTQLYDYLEMAGGRFSIPQTCFFDYTGKLISGPFVGSRSYMSWKSIIDDVLADAPKRTTLAKPTIKTQPKAQILGSGRLPIPGPAHPAHILHIDPVPDVIIGCDLSGKFDLYRLIALFLSLQAADRPIPGPAAFPADILHHAHIRDAAGDLLGGQADLQCLDPSV